MVRTPKIALVGNPNCGKSSLFNALTGLRQKVGNFPGVTVDKKAGVCRLTETQTAQILDLPGTYSLYPKSADERVATEVLLHPGGTDFPDLTIVIIDAANLKRNLLFGSQIMDLDRPVILALTMMDLATSKGIAIDLPELERQMGVPVVAINPRKGKGIAALKKTILQALENIAVRTSANAFIDSRQLTGSWLQEIRDLTDASSEYAALQIACAGPEMSFLSAAQRIQLPALLDSHQFVKARVQAQEVIARYTRIDKVMQAAVHIETPVQKRLRAERIDKVLLHPFWGNLILLTVLFLLFQSIFWLAEYPMDWVETAFSWTGSTLSRILPQNWATDLLINGLLAGISGIAVFIPQIALLFGFITILEDSGYMARISFLTDRLMRSVGLNGRSVMPLISGMACAVPAVMAARTVANKKERLITILVTPLMSCSARLPVYTILISLVIPDYRFGLLTLHGLVLMGLYLLGFVGALIVSKVLSLFIKVRERTWFMLELPHYRAPRWKNVATTMVEKATVFVRDAGKVILVISIVLWGLASYGPASKNSGTPTAWVIATPLETSFAGHMGHWIEPAIRPLGYDWKIGVALITSFAAREVFVGTMATLYSVADETPSQEATLRSKMAAAKTADGQPVYTLATGVSLLLFYVFAMQCMSTLAIVRKETGSWLYPALQFLYMGAMAWGAAWIAYTLLR
ncbi:MAG: ferrous iron transport protein B [Sphingobacteriales bacterium]|nr:MAG: ferrous iron transport protein B [Sphingobacteriales bacterium]